MVLFLGICTVTIPEGKKEAIKRQKIENCRLRHVELVSFEADYGIFIVKKSFAGKYSEQARYCLFLLPKFDGKTKDKTSFIKISLSDGSSVGFDDCGNAFLL